ncbi:MAG: polysaccharide lyase [Elainellaceae cyanobacterium]
MTIQIHQMAQSTPNKSSSSSSQSAPPSSLLFQDNFENGIANEWIYERPRNSAVQVVDAPDRSGHAVKFDLRRNDGERAEIRLAREPAGAERWYGFKTFLPDNWQADRSFEMIAQWHGWPDQDLGESWRSPPLSLIVEGDRIKIHSRWDPKQITENNNPAPEGGTETVWQGDYTKGEWTDWVFRVDWSHQSDGVLQVWKDGEQIVNRRGANTYNDQSGVYFKTGLYKPHWKYENSDTSTTNRRTLFIDDVRVGNGQMNRDQINGLSEDQALIPAGSSSLSSKDSSNPISASPSNPSNSVSRSSPLASVSRAETIEFDHILSHGGEAQDKNVKVSRSDNNKTLKLSGNGWKKLAIDYNVTPETMLTFEFRSNSEGEIHGIGFDRNNRVTSSDASKTFKLLGTQDWGVSRFDDYVTGSGWKRYEISVGEFFKGEMHFLTLVNDQDVSNPTATSEFKNIRLFESSGVGDAGDQQADPFRERSDLDPKMFASLATPQGLS